MKGCPLILRFQFHEPGEHTITFKGLFSLLESKTLYRDFEFPARPDFPKITGMAKKSSLHKDIGVGGPENDSFPLLYVVKMSLRRWVGGSKKPQNTLT